MTPEEAGSTPRNPPLTRYQRAMYHADKFFYKTLSCRFDCWPMGLRLWWFNWTARRSRFFHRRWCPSCRNR